MIRLLPIPGALLSPLSTDRDAMGTLPWAADATGVGNNILVTFCAIHRQVVQELRTPFLHVHMGAR